MEIIDDTAATPLSGLGIPKPLTGNLQDYWSRRITQKHRMIYTYDDEKHEITIISCFGRYDV